MSDAGGGPRRATDEEIQAERRANPGDIWMQEALDLDAHTVAVAARTLWGPPIIGVTGESLWRLWSDDLGVPIYIAIGLLPPAILLSGGMLPDDDEVDRLGDEIRAMLSRAEEGDVAG